MQFSPDIRLMLGKFPAELRGSASECAEALRAILRCDLWHLRADTPVAEMLSWVEQVSLTQQMLYEELHRRLGIPLSFTYEADDDTTTFRDFVGLVNTRDNMRVK